MSASQRAFKAVKRPASGSLLRIVSYNVLANKYVLTGYHNYCEKEFRAWGYRLPRLCQEIDNLQGDIICLQEIEEGVFREEIGQHLQIKGFQVSNATKVSNIRYPDSPVN
jgi:mRNA deadenylase 3'-5' endonuclease subunit Ccr4